MHETAVSLCCNWEQRQLFFSFQLEREHRPSAPGRQPCSLVLAVGVSPCPLHLWRKGTEEEQPVRDLPEPAGERAGHPAAHGDCREQLGVASGL